MVLVYGILGILHINQRTPFGDSFLYPDARFLATAMPIVPSNYTDTSINFSSPGMIRHWEMSNVVCVIFTLAFLLIRRINNTVL